MEQARSGHFRQQRDQVQQNIPQQKTTQQNMSQSHAARRNSAQQHTSKQRSAPGKNSTMKKLLWIILILEIITAIELLALIKVLAANEQYALHLGQKVTSVNTDKSQDSGKQENTQNVTDGSNGEKVSGGEDWKLVLVNKWNEIDPDYVPELTEVAEGHKVDVRIADALTAMIKGAKKAGHDIYIMSAYRDINKQTYLYQAEVEEWLGLGYSRRGAEEKAGQVVAYPGTSEHQLGLAVDLVSSEYVALDEGAERTEGYQWLVEHCQEYGFILRYPNGATEITGIIYEPWHFRYVGEEAAWEIMESGITLEEYLNRAES